MTFILLLANAFLLGLAHALEPDHVAAVSTFLSRQPGRSSAIRYCVRWGLGHALPLLAATALAAGIGLTLPAQVAAYAERGVGAMLILLGVWLLRDVRAGRLHVHAHEHDGVIHTHLHTHAPGEAGAHDHRHAAFFVGVIHGFSGSASVLLLALVAGTSSPRLSGAYVVTFSAGVILAMALYGWSAGALLERVAARKTAWLRLVQTGAGCCSVVLGGYWLS